MLALSPSFGVDLSKSHKTEVFGKSNWSWFLICCDLFYWAFTFIGDPAPFGFNLILSSYSSAQPLLYLYYAGVAGATSF